MTKMLTQKERFELQKMLESVLQQNGDTWDYVTGWNDQRVAQECKIPSSIVKNTRAKTFGVLFKRAEHGANLARLRDDLEQVRGDIALIKSVLRQVGLDEELKNTLNKSNGEFHDAT